MSVMFNKRFLPEASTAAMETAERSVVSKKQKIQPPFSNKTLYHPSFMSLYTNPGARQCCGDNQTVHPMVPQEFFYTDPTMGGTRIPNHVHELKDFDCFQLNTPPPIMSACLAPVNRPDPFRTEQHLTRNLGSSTWERGALLPPVNPMWMVIQLTEEEDQAITNLLKLHHGEGKFPQVEEGSQYGDALYHCSGQANELYSNGLHSTELGTLGKHWSDAELDVANTLLTMFAAAGEGSDLNASGNLLLSSSSNLPDFTYPPAHERVLSKSEGDALCGLLNLGLPQT